MGTNPNQPGNTRRERGSLYQEVTDRIIADLERGRVPWVQPWAVRARPSACPAMPPPAGVIPSRRPRRWMGCPPAWSAALPCGVPSGPRAG